MKKARRRNARDPRRGSAGRSTRRLAVESLEARTLLSTLPTPTAAAPIAVASTPANSNESSPSIAVDPSNPQKLVSTWVLDDPNLAPGPTVIVEYAYSINGGTSWSGPSSIQQLIDPTTSGTSLKPFAFGTDPTVAFDRNDNFYILMSQHQSSNAASDSAGALVLNTYNFSTSVPSPVLQSKEVYAWDGSDQAVSPTMAVDDNVASFSDVNSAGQTVTQTDASAGAVYVAWQSNDTPPKNPPGNFNPNRILLTASSNGGSTFSGITVVNPNGNANPAELATPTLTISQGTATGVTPAVPGGQVTVGYVDYNSGANASPPFDILLATPVSGATVGTFSSTPSPNTIVDGTTTSYPVTVTVPTNSPFFVNDLSVALNAVYPTLANLKAVLIPPSGSGLSPVTLFNNGALSGANFGTTSSGAFVGTTFDDHATRSITDGSAAAPYDGMFRPQQGLDAAYHGATAAQINGTWTLQITSTTTVSATPPPEFLQNFSLNFTSGLVSGNQSTIATDFVRESATGNITTNPASPTGIGPELVLASDNTLGAYSQYQGRIYAAYVGHVNSTFNPTTNTDIFLSYSTDGGKTWISAGMVNDDYGPTDGFSGSNPGLAGRPQFLPSIAVDETTGALALSWYDARNDASGDRVAMYVTYSIDGGQTFSPQIYVNQSQIATDAITGDTVNLGPIPDNESSGNPNTQSTFGFGIHEGLAVYGGHVYTAWSSNLNGGSNGKELLNIESATVEIPAGPRIISSTEGPVGDAGDSVNTQRAADGGPEASAFDVTFDEPVDPSTFTTDLVQVMFHSATSTNSAGVPIAVIGVTALNPTSLGATEFQVSFTPSSGVGTYSYSISPEVSDRIRTITSSTAAGSPLPAVASTNVPQALPVYNHSTNTPGVVLSTLPYNNPSVSSEVVSSLTVTVNISETFDPDLVLILIAPNGTQVVLAEDVGSGTSPANFSNTTFSDGATRSITAGTAPFSGTFRPLQSLSQLAGQAINGNWTLELENSGDDGTAMLNSWSLTVTPGTGSSGVKAGNLMDQNADGTSGETTPGTGGTDDVYAIPEPDGGTAFQAPYNQDTLPLIVSGPHVISSQVPGAPASSNNLVQNTPVGAIDVTFDRDMNPATFTGAQVLSVMGPNGLVPGPYTVIADPSGTDPDPSHPRTFQIDFSSQDTSGTYTVTLASSVTAEDGAALDTNENAGVSVLFGTAPLGASAPSTYSNSTPTTLAANTTVFSTLSIPTSTVIQGMTVSLAITSANDSNLEVFLIAPDGTQIELIKNAGTSGSANFTGTILDDSALASIESGSAPFTGRYQPDQPLSAFNGKNAQGTWTLSVKNDGSTVDGTLNSWSMTLLPPAATTYNSTGSPVTILQPKAMTPQTTTSTIAVSDSYTVQAVSVQLNITYPHDPDLTAYLVAPDGTKVQLFSGVGTTGTQANFSNTVFADTASTAITAGGAPFYGSFTPQQSGGFLQALVTGHTGGAINSEGNWTLQVIDGSGDGFTGTINSWSLTLTQNVPISGLGEPAADQATVGFTISNTAATNSQSSTSWTQVGPTTIGDGSSLNGYAGQVSSVAVDPSDPSGNTVYAAGASGGVWKTTDFMTSSANGPTWIPLTNFGPTSSLNIGSIAVFARNGDPNQSIIVAGTGNPSSNYGSGGDTSAGVGFLISMNGGQTWQLLDSTNNALPPAQRDHKFVGDTTYQIAVDPKLTPGGGVIIYAALGGPTGGLWRSTDTGQTWTPLSTASIQGTTATSVVLDLDSATVNALSNPTGNVQTIFAAFQAPPSGDSVYTSANEGQSLEPMVGTNFDAYIQELGTVINGLPVQVSLTNTTTPPKADRVTLAVPAPLPSTVPGNDAENRLYEGWLYAAVANPDGTLAGLFVTKDDGQTWTQVNTYETPPSTATGTEYPLPAIPTNDEKDSNYDVIQSTTSPNGNYSLSLAVDPTNPEIVYLGGTSDGQTSGMIRVDIAGLYDSHSFVSYENNLDDGGLITFNTGSDGPVTVIDNTKAHPFVAGNNGFVISANGTDNYTNLIQSPGQAFSTGSTVEVSNASGFLNSGYGATWTTFDQLLYANASDLSPSSNVHDIVTYVDPLTGETRLIVGDDQGVFTGVDDDGTLNLGIGNATAATFSRNGNLQIAQDLSGAAEPSALAAQVAQALFYSSGITVGVAKTGSTSLTTGSTTGIGTTTSEAAQLGPVDPLDGTRNTTTVATDRQGHGIVYQYIWPGYSGSDSNFFEVSVDGGTFIPATNGLVQAPNDPQWPLDGQNPFNSAAALYPDNINVGDFTVNPLNGSQVIISSNAGRIFETTNQGVLWQVIGDPSSLDGSYAPALTYGAPDPSSPDGIGNLDNFIYAGTVDGNIFVTQTGGGTAGGGNQWTPIDTGLDGSPVMQIITDPTRGSHDAFAVTAKGVYYISNSIASTTNPTPTWVNITGNLFSKLASPFNDISQGTSARISYLSGIQADWNYVVPNATGTGTHPVLYVSANAGVYRSIDGGQTWTLFPGAGDPTLPAGGAQVDGGGLPDEDTSSIDLVQGDIDPTTGRATPQAGDPDILLASTFGSGQYVIRLAPIVFSNTVALATGSSNGTDSQGNLVVTSAQPVFDGLSEQTAFGNSVTITLVDATNALGPVIIGTGTTDSSGNFSVQVNPNAFTSDGIKTIEIYATDQSGTRGNVATLKIDLEATNLGQSQVPVTPTLELNPSNDSSGGQDITNNPQVYMLGVTSPSVSVAIYQEVGGSISGSALGTGTSDASGGYSILIGPLTDGTYNLVAVATNSFGSSTSSPLAIMIDTVGPTTAPTLALDPTESGNEGAGITANRRPTLVGATDPDVFVDILNSTGTVLGTTTSDSSGNYSVQLPGFLTNGSITLYARARDVANNLGPKSVPFALTIAASTVAPGIPSLQAGSDTGVVGDDITSVRSPAFNVAGVVPDATLYLLRNGTVVSSVATGAGGTVAIGDPGPLLDGTYSYTDYMVDGAGNTSPTSGTVGVSIATVQGDYTGGGTADLAVFERTDPGLLQTYVAGGVVPPGGTAFGSGALDIPLQGDLDGDGKMDQILYRPSAGTWYVDESTGGFQEVQFGGPDDIPVVADFDGVGHDELGVYRPSTGQWFVAGHAGAVATFGGPEDVPVPLANYAGPGRAALAVYRESTGQWFIAGQSGGISFGGPGDIPVPLYNYVGDGRADLAVYRPSTSTWYVAGQATGINFGGGGDIPIAEDVDGVDHDELGVYRPSTGQWYVAGHGVSIATYGGPTDIPVGAPYAYRALPGSADSISALSAEGFDMGVSALSLSARSVSSVSSSTTASPSVMTVAASPSTSVSTSSATKAVAAPSPQGSRPNQSTPSQDLLHDIALASLKIGRKRTGG